MPVRRVTMLALGLTLFGVSVAMLVLADLGLASWDVFHQGVAKQTGLSQGTATICTSLSVLLLWIPLRQKPGIGTLANAFVVGLVVDAVLALTPDVGNDLTRWVLLIAGVLLNGVATGMYIGAGLGPGPRDGLMTGIAKRGHSVRMVRTCIEIVVLAVGWLLGGTVGVGTVLFAVAIGPLAHLTIPWFTSRSERELITADGL